MRLPKLNIVKEVKPYQVQRKNAACELTNRNYYKNCGAHLPNCQTAKDVCKQNAILELVTTRFVLEKLVPLVCKRFPLLYILILQVIF